MKDCIHCGCLLIEHRGGSPESPAQTCPALIDFGSPQLFPATTYAEDKARDYRAYWARVDTYWSAGTTFEAAKPGIAFK